MRVRKTDISTLPTGMPTDGSLPKPTITHRLGNKNEGVGLSFPFGIESVGKMKRPLNGEVGHSLTFLVLGWRMWSHRAIHFGVFKEEVGVYFRSGKRRGKRGVRSPPWLSGRKIGEVGVYFLFGRRMFATRDKGAGMWKGDWVLHGHRTWVSLILGAT